MAAARKPASRRKSAKSRPRARAQRSSLGALGLPALEQRHLDLIGLGLVALGIFLAFPVYLGWDGGAAGQAATRGLAYAVGQVAYGVPVGIVAAGALFVLRPVLPTMRPFRAGALCLFAALSLMLAAGTFGIGPEGVRHGYWDAPFFEPRGGIAGDALLWAAASAFSTIGAHILALFLLVAGVLLLTGASVAGVLRATGLGAGGHDARDRPRGAGARAARAGRCGGRGRRAARARARAGAVRSARTRGHGGHRARDACRGAPAAPRRACRPARVLVRRDALSRTSTASRCPSPVSMRRKPPAREPEPAPEREPEQLVFDEPEPAQPEDVTAVMPRRKLSPDDLTPQGRLRGSVTDDPEFQWRLPSPELLRRSSAEQSRPGHRRPGEARPPPCSRRSATSGSTRRSAAHDRRPAHHALRAAPRARASR